MGNHPFSMYNIDKNYLLVVKTTHFEGDWKSEDFFKNNF